MQVDETGELRGRVHVGKQDLLKLQDAGVESVWCHNIRLTCFVNRDGSHMDMSDYSGLTAHFSCHDNPCEEARKAWKTSRALICNGLHDSAPTTLVSPDPRASAGLDTSMSDYGGFTAYLSCHDNPCEEGMNSMDMCNLTIHIRKPGRLPSFDGHVQFITTGPCIPFFIQIAFKFPSSNNPLSITTGKLRHLQDATNPLAI